MTFYDKILSSLKEKLGIDNLALEIPREKSFGDFATNIAMQLAKTEHKSPRDIANTLLPKIQEIDFIESADVAGAGFINIKIKNDFIINSLRTDSSIPKHSGIKIDFDYGAYNIAKDMHIGHLRTSIVGDTLYRVTKFLGNTPISYNHLGDWGRPMAMIIAWIVRTFPNDWNKSDFQVNASDLNTFYPAASAYAHEHPEFLEQVQNIKKEFQKGDNDYYKLYEKFSEISMAQMHSVVSRLNIVPFDNDLGERNAAKYLEPVEKILRDKKLLIKSEGAEIVELKRDDDAAPMPPFMFLDSRGADTYDSTDLAALYYRKITDNPDKIIYLTDARQKLHFEQLFRVAEMSGIFPSENLEHQYFGAITGSDGKPFKTRDGNVATLTDIIDAVENAARERAPNLPIETIKMIAMASLKFNDLMHDTKSDYVFDPNMVVQFDGRTGAYILYTVVRLNSALKKSDNRNFCSISNISNDYERDLMIKILDFPRMIETMFEKRAPDILANYTYDLCQLANTFYHNCEIKNDANRIAITQNAVKTLSTCIDLMGMQIPKEM